MTRSYDVASTLQHSRGDLGRRISWSACLFCVVCIADRRWRRLAVASSSNLGNKFEFLRFLSSKKHFPGPTCHVENDVSTCVCPSSFARFRRYLAVSVRRTLRYPNIEGLPIFFSPSTTLRILRRTPSISMA